MKKLTMIAIATVGMLAIHGCGTAKSRSVEAKGMWISDSGQMAIGQVQVDAVPEQVDSAIIHYAEDTAWLSPSTKTHKIDVVLTGTNSSANASTITEAICKTYIEVAPRIAQTEASAQKGKTTLDTVEHNRTATQVERQSSSAQTQSAAPEGKSGTGTGECANGECEDGECPNGACTVPTTNQ